MKFKDHFSGFPDDYSKFRPVYPEALFACLSSLTTGHARAWDCATGSGQAASGLSQHYAEVIATDASSAQIENAIKKHNVTYQVAAAEQTGIETNSVDLVTVAQALHWFDIAAFAREADRVLKPAGVLAVWTYNLLQVRPDMDAVINRLYTTTLADYWPPERALVENGYAGIELPFNEIPAPAFHMAAHWNLYQLTGYLGTWSAVRRFTGALGVNPVGSVHDELSGLWGDPETVLPVSWPLSLRLWKKNA